jgi:hypothetical protein
MLTDDEIWNIWDNHLADIPSYDRPPFELALYRGVEAAVLSKLATGVRIEPDVMTYAHGDHRLPLYSHSLKQFNTAIAAARVQLANLRELAKKANELDHNERPEWYHADNIQKQGAYYPKNARFIAAASPDVVIGLLDEIERLRSVIQLIYDNSIRVDWPDDIWDAIKGELK